MNQIICPKCGSANTSPSTIPLIHCNNCQADFGGDHRDFEKNTSRIVLNTYKKGTASQNLTFSKTAAGATIEGPFLCYYPDLPEIYINHQQWQQLLQDFYDLFVIDWKSEYSNVDAPDDFGWDLKIIFDNQEPVISKGQGCYPPYWAALMDLFVSIGLPNIGNKLGQNFLQLQAHTP